MPDFRFMQMSVRVLRCTSVLANSSGPNEILQTLHSIRIFTVCQIPVKGLSVYTKSLDFHWDFPTFLKSGPGACLIWGKKPLDHQIGKTILNGLKKHIRNSRVKLVLPTIRIHEKLHKYVN